MSLTWPQWPQWSQSRSAAVKSGFSTIRTSLALGAAVGAPGVHAIQVVVGEDAEHDLGRVRRAQRITPL